MRSRISIHAPARGATNSGFLFPLVKRFQSTHPRGVRLPTAAPTQFPFPISIHAPARGATDAYLKVLGAIVFQSTHPRGVRRCWNTSQRKAWNFNPRTREGCDHKYGIFLKRFDQFQSTHPRGVRRIWALQAMLTSEFQSTHPRGVRLLRQQQPVKIIKFQSTHPRGVRHRRRIIRLFSTLFQSTHPRGVRPQKDGLCRTHSRFQSTHTARGATITARIQKCTIYFNPRTREGCDNELFSGQEWYEISIHAPARGATLTNITVTH